MIDKDIRHQLLTSHSCTDKHTLTHLNTQEHIYTHTPYTRESTRTNLVWRYMPVILALGCRRQRGQRLT